MMKNMAFIIVMAVVMKLCGCASAPATSKYPDRFVERPYTLFEGMSRGELVCARGFSKGAQHLDPTQPVPLNAFWEHAFSDRLSWVWFVLPLGLKYQAVKTDSHVLGAMIYLQPGPPENFFVAPMVSFYDRIKISPDISVETAATAELVARTKPSGFDHVVSLSSGPLLQVHDRLAARPWIGISREYGNAGTLGSIKPDHDALGGTARVSVPAGLEVKAMPLRQWEVVMMYSHLLVRTGGGGAHRYSAYEIRAAYWW